MPMPNDAAGSSSDGKVIPFLHPDAAIIRRQIIQAYEEYDARRGRVIPIVTQSSDFPHELKKPTELRWVAVSYFLGMAVLFYSPYLEIESQIMAALVTTYPLAPQILFFTFLGTGTAIALDSIGQAKHNCQIFGESFWNHIRF